MIKLLQHRMKEGQDMKINRRIERIRKVIAETTVALIPTKYLVTEIGTSHFVLSDPDNDTRYVLTVMEMDETEYEDFVAWRRYNRNTK